MFFHPKEDRLQAAQRAAVTHDLQRCKAHVPKIDSSTNWGSTVKLFRDGRLFFPLAEKLVEDDAEFPEVLNDAGMAMSRCIEDVLEIVDCTQALLQSDDALLGDYIPLTKIMRDQILAHRVEALGRPGVDESAVKLNTLYLSRLDQTEERNLKQSPGGALACDWKTTWDLMRVASVIGGRGLPIVAGRTGRVTVNLADETWPV